MTDQATFQALGEALTGIGPIHVQLAVENFDFQGTMGRYVGKEAVNDLLTTPDVEHTGTEIDLHTGQLNKAGEHSAIRAVAPDQPGVERLEDMRGICQGILRLGKGAR